MDSGSSITQTISSTGFLIHSFYDMKRNKIFLVGRLENADQPEIGFSFAAADTQWKPYFHIYKSDANRCKQLLANIRCTMQTSSAESFAKKDALMKISFQTSNERSGAASILRNAGIISPDMDMKIIDMYLIEKQLKGPFHIEGGARTGRLVNLVFSDPVISPLVAPLPSIQNVKLVIASIDIETNETDQSINALSIVVKDSSFRAIFSIVLLVWQHRGTINEESNIEVHDSEVSLLKSFIKHIEKLDPDVITGWNILDFDFPHLMKRFEFHRLPFSIGRSFDTAKYFPGEGRRSASVIINGRQVIDALRIARASPDKYDDYSLETVSQAVLGKGKLNASTGRNELPRSKLRGIFLYRKLLYMPCGSYPNSEFQPTYTRLYIFPRQASGYEPQLHSNKIAELTKMYHEEPIKFAEYCLQDSELVLDVLEKTGLWRLTLERAQLTGVSLDKAWTSVAAFERVYGMELAKRNIAPVSLESSRKVSGAAGGTILDPESGLFTNVAVFDFRSLYPTIMRTFNIDPAANAAANAAANTKELFAGEKSSPGNIDNCITAPNGARFIRDAGILPALIAEYFSARKEAIASNDTVAAYVYKILMNSFYGVLGTSSCRYAKTELAGAITSFARKWLLFSKDWFEKNGYQVLYGDTDSLFVKTNFPYDVSYHDFSALCKELAEKLNHELSAKIHEEYQLDSFLELRFEKPYRRFMIPPLRSIKNSSALRGRAKGYAGFVLHEDGSLNVEVKGMEAVRSDSTPLAKRIQIELLELVFRNGTEVELRNHVMHIIKELQSGKLDKELIYKKRLRRPPESYTASTPPQVKAARLLGWKGKRGKIEYYWTVNGAEPAEKLKSPIDYNHYIDTQILSVAGSIALASGWNVQMFPEYGKNRQALEDGQIELDW